MSNHKSADMIAYERWEAAHPEVRPLDDILEESHIECMKRRGWLAAEDITVKRHRGNPFSEAANPSDNKKSRDMRAIYEAYRKLGPHGSIAESVYLRLGLVAQTGSARCSDLKRLGYLVGTGRKSPTKLGSSAEVLVASEFLEETE